MHGTFNILYPKIKENLHRSVTDKESKLCTPCRIRLDEGLCYIQYWGPLLEMNSRKPENMCGAEVLHQNQAVQAHVAIFWKRDSFIIFWSVK